MTMMPCQFHCYRQPHHFQFSSNFADKIIQIFIINNFVFLKLNKRDVRGSKSDSTYPCQLSYAHIDLLLRMIRHLLRKKKLLLFFLKD